MTIPLGSHGDAPLRFDALRFTRSTTARDAEVVPEEDGHVEPEAVDDDREEPSLWTAMDARAKQRADQRMAQIRQILEGQVDGGSLAGLFGEEPEGGAVGPGFGTPPLEGAPKTPFGAALDGATPGGGPALFEMPPHPMLADTSRANAKAALDEAVPIDPTHPYAKDKADTRRRLRQLGFETSNDNRMHVFDVNRTHGNAVTRTLAGETALAPGAAVTLDAPTDEAHAANRSAYFRDNGGSDDPTTSDLVRKAAGNLIGSTHGMAMDVMGLGMANGVADDGRKTFVNMSLGASPQKEAEGIAARMVIAEPGTRLYDEAVSVLGRPPRYETVEVDGRTGKRPNADDMRTLQREHVIPTLEAEMATPEFDTEMGDAREFLRTSAEMARQNGVMIFQAAGNEFSNATAAGHPELSEGALSNIDGIFRVGAIDPNGPGVDDDAIAAFSAAGPIDASATGEDVPVGVKDSAVVELDGTSFASPIMTETAYVMSGVNPNLSLQNIEDILEDPRVARDIEGTTRDGAGSVDQFAAILLARNPKLTRTQIDRIRDTLDANPDMDFMLGSNGRLRR